MAIACGEVAVVGGTHAVLADGAFVEGDILTLIRGRHTIKLGGELDKSYQNYTNWGDVSSGNFQFNGIGTAQFWSGSNYPNTTGGYGTVASGSPYADFLLGHVYGWFFIAATLVLGALFTVSAVAALVIHLDVAPTRRIARTVTNTLLADLFEGRILSEFMAVTNLTTNPDPVLSAAHVSYVVWAPDTPLALYLDHDPRWRVVERTPVALVFAHR